MFHLHRTTAKLVIQLGAEDRTGPDFIPTGVCALPGRQYERSIITLNRIRGPDWALFKVKKKAGNLKKKTPSKSKMFLAVTIEWKSIVVYIYTTQNKYYTHISNTEF